MPDQSATAEALLALAKLRPVPHHLRVYVGDDEPITVAVANVRKRWQRIASVLEPLDWHQIDARDKSGSILATYRTADEPEPLDSLQVDATAGGATIREVQLAQTIVQAMQLGAKLATDAADKAVQRHAATFRALADGMRGQLEALQSGSRAAVGQYQQALVVQRELLTAVRDASGDEGEGEGLGALAPLIAAVAAHAKKPTNGKAHHASTKKAGH